MSIGSFYWYKSILSAPVLLCGNILNTIIKIKNKKIFKNRKTSGTNNIYNGKVRNGRDTFF